MPQSLSPSLSSSSSLSSKRHDRHRQSCRVGQRQIDHQDRIESHDGESNHRADNGATNRTEMQTKGKDDHSHDKQDIVAGNKASQLTNNVIVKSQQSNQSLTHLKSNQHSNRRQNDHRNRTNNQQGQQKWRDNKRDRDDRNRDTNRNRDKYIDSNRTHHNQINQSRNTYERNSYRQETTSRGHKDSSWQSHHYQRSRDHKISSRDYLHTGSSQHNLPSNVPETIINHPQQVLSQRLVECPAYVQCRVYVNQEGSYGWLQGDKVDLYLWPSTNLLELTHLLRAYRPTLRTKYQFQYWRVGGGWIDDNNNRLMVDNKMTQGTEKEMNIIQESSHHKGSAYKQNVVSDQNNVQLVYESIKSKAHLDVPSFHNSKLSVPPNSPNSSGAVWMGQVFCPSLLNSFSSLKSDQDSSQRTLQETKWRVGDYIEVRAL